MATDKHTTTTIFKTLRGRICLLDYPPGTILREAALAKEFGISRTPIRAVLQRLEHGALVTVRDAIAVGYIQRNFIAFGFMRLQAALRTT